MEHFNNPQIKENAYQEDMNYHNSLDIERKIDRFTFQQIELFLQQQVNISYSVPSLCPSDYFRICINFYW
jgi:hypothetical protein